MPRQIDCFECEGSGEIDYPYTDEGDMESYTCDCCKDGKITVYTEAEVDELNKQLEGFRSQYNRDDEIVNTLTVENKKLREIIKTLLLHVDDGEWPCVTEEAERALKDGE